MSDLLMVKRKTDSKDTNLSFFKILIFTLFSFLLFFGGFGTEIMFWNVMGVCFGIIMFLILVYKKVSIKLPPHFKVFSIFLLFAMLSLDWTKHLITSSEFLFLFIGGWLFWLVFYNLKSHINFPIENIILLLGLIFGGLFVSRFIWNWDSTVGLSLFFTPTTIGSPHNHIGDFWAVVSVVIFYKLYKNPKKYFLWLFIPLAIFFMAMSLSRAAYLALFSGIFFLAYKGGAFKKLYRYKYIVTVLVILFLSLLFLVATQKSILFSRPYFIHSLVGLKYYPFGVGLGNFGFISIDPRTHILGLDQTSIYTHNIVLEMISGVGIFGLIFAYWLFKVCKDILSGSRFLNNRNFVYQAIFLTLTVNFLFDYTYFNSTMSWLWFISLALSQKD